MFRTRFAVILPVAALTGAATFTRRDAPSPDPLDPPRWQDQEEMSGKDDRPIPGARWADGRPGSVRNFRGARVAVDFPDQPCRRRSRSATTRRC